MLKKELQPKQFSSVTLTTIPGSNLRITLAYSKQENKISSLLKTENTQK